MCLDKHHQSIQNIDLFLFYFDMLTLSLYSTHYNDIGMPMFFLVYNIKQPVTIDVQQLRFEEK